MRYLAQGGNWSDNMTPGEGVRIIAYEAVLELDQDLVFPPVISRFQLR